MALGRLSAIDCLRGLAALIVVFYHAHEINWTAISAIWHSNGLTPNLNAYLSYLTAPLFYGFVGVPLFFVLSGYCIHRPNAARLARDASHQLNLKAYFMRRLWRIYPVLAFALLLTLVLDGYTRVHFPSDYKLGDNSWRCLFINLFSLQNLAGPSFGSNGPLWTLALELHFYFLYPLLFWSTKRFGLARTVGAVTLLSVGSLVLLRALRSELVFFLPYWFTWIVGFLIAEWDCGRVRLAWQRWWPCLALAIVPAALLPLLHERNLAEPFLAIVFGAVLLWSLHPRGQQFWSHRALRFLRGVGVFSYTLYAIHVPVLVFLRSWLQGGAKSEYVAVPLFFTAVCVAVAMVGFWMVERWSLRVPDKAPAAPGTERAPAGLPAARV